MLLYMTKAKTLTPFLKGRQSSEDLIKKLIHVKSRKNFYNLFPSFLLLDRIVLVLCEV